MTSRVYHWHVLVCPLSPFTADDFIRSCSSLRTIFIRVSFSFKNRKKVLKQQNSLPPHPKPEDLHTDRSPCQRRNSNHRHHQMMVANEASGKPQAEERKEAQVKGNSLGGGARSESRRAISRRVVPAETLREVP